MDVHVLSNNPRQAPGRRSASVDLPVPSGPMTVTTKPVGAVTRPIHRLVSSRIPIATRAGLRKRLAMSAARALLRRAGVREMGIRAEVESLEPTRLPKIVSMQ